LTAQTGIWVGDSSICGHGHCQLGVDLGRDDARALVWRGGWLEMNAAFGRSMGCRSGK
jgi:hypothetical protein